MHLLHRLAGLLPALAVVAASLMWFQVENGGLRSGVWQAHHFDHADYRFVAEHVWGVPHDAATYAPEFAGDWGHYLQTVPFRDIGVGTLYLLSAKLYGFLFNVEHVDPAALSLWMPGTFALLLALAYVAFFQSCRRLYGTAAALLATIVLAWPQASWPLTRELLTGPLLRVCFICLAAAVISCRDQWAPSRLPFAFACAALLVAAHAKAQWIVLAAIVTVAILLHYRRRLCASLPRTSFAIALPLLIPVSLVAVHALGWGTVALTPGSALHLNFKTGGAFLASTCASWRSETIPAFCRFDAHRADGYWGVYVGDRVSGRDLTALDRRVLPYVLRSPREALAELGSGLAAATNAPHAPASFARTVAILDALTWVALLLGLLSRSTRLLAVVGLGLWIVPAIGSIVAVPDARYLTPMAGIPLVSGSLVAVSLSRMGTAQWVRSIQAQYRVLRSTGSFPSSTPVGVG